MNKDLETCPICNSKSLLVKHLNSNFIQKEIEAYYNKKINGCFTLSSYDVRRCSSCSLEFASPLQAGDNNFYKWITSHSGYYPDYRWEWGILLDELKKLSLNSASLLEIGCGAGKFLELAQQIPNLKAVGLDTTISSVEQCRSKNLEVYCDFLESFLSSSDSEHEKFDFVVAFHCLEHVNDPKQLIQSMLAATKPKGSIFISTPYSPMSFETSWFDPLNYPPHHMTRWNAQAYRELANQLGLKINFFMPSAGRAIDRTLCTLNYAWNGPAHVLPWRKMQLSALKRPVDTFLEWLRQQRREKVNEQVAADVVLVELTF
jgi:2-polyprenyl-3-methyl-5-hydroxy-6-metoxy-1,4-benzoquinol methylase